MPTSDDACIPLSDSCARAQRAVLACLLLPACDPQAGDGYMGEPLLSVRGQATVSTPTGGEAIVPALCFIDDTTARASAGTKSLELSHLPPEIEEDLRSDQRIGPEPPWPHDADHLVRIVDIENVGQFPSDFRVDVYVPPPVEALTASVAGEPRTAYGQFCAVKRDHRPSTHVVQFNERYRCNGAENGASTDCYIRMLWNVAGSDRYYTERYACPDGVSNYEDCALTSKQGDATLKLETWAEDVLGVAATPSVIYLESPAAPESQTAWIWGGQQAGLPAGYHLFAARDYRDPALHQCFPDAEETIAQLASDYRDDQHLLTVIRGGPSESFALTSAQALAWSDATLAAEMKKCPDRPGPPRADDDAVAIEISPKPRTNFGPPPTR